MGDSMPTTSDLPAGAPEAPDAAADDQTWTAYLLQLQATACSVLGSDLYATLLAAAAQDVRDGGPAWTVLRPHATRDTGAALALRFMAAVHRLVLRRQAPALALHFPSVGGRADARGAWPALRAALADHAEQLTGDVALPCQTNEVGRCAALVGGFLSAAADSAKPLRLLEIGASAGLNLHWDRYGYADGQSSRRWGEESSPVQLQGVWDVPAHLLEVNVDVRQRQGCDPRPIDPASPDGRLALTASVWADQPLRHERLRGALELAAREPVAVDAARAIDWLPPRLAEPAQGLATIVYHSVVLQYLAPEERSQVVAAIAAAGERARESGPLYWVRMEPEHPLRAMAVRMTRWPGGAEQLLATAGAHGNPLRWRHP